MNNDKLLIIVVVLTIYLLCFKKSEGQEICQYQQGDLDSAIDTRIKTLFNTTIKDDEITSPVTIPQGLIVDRNDYVAAESDKNFIIRIVRNSNPEDSWQLAPGLSPDDKHLYTRRNTYGFVKLA